LSNLRFFGTALGDTGGTRYQKPTARSRADCGGPDVRNRPRQYRRRGGDDERRRSGIPVARPAWADRCGIRAYFAQDRPSRPHSPVSYWP